MEWRRAAAAAVVVLGGGAGRGAQAAPDLPRALLVDVLPPDWLARAQALGCIALDANYRVLDATVIAAAHDAGLKVLSYTVNDPERAAQLLGWGLDGLITDAVDAIAPAG